jgi:hypothetical protein
MRELKDAAARRRAVRPPGVVALLLLENMPGRRQRREEDGVEKDKCRPRPREDEVRARSMVAGLLWRCGWCVVVGG